MQTQGAITNLINRYRAVLRKCGLLNVFGSLAIAGAMVLGGAATAGAQAGPVYVGSDAAQGTWIKEENGTARKSGFVGEWDGTSSSGQESPIDTLYGGKADTGSSEENQVTVTGGEINTAIYGGYSEEATDTTAKVSKNTVTLDGLSKLSNIKNIYGGAAKADTGVASVTNNTVDIKGFASNDSQYETIAQRQT